MIKNACGFLCVFLFLCLIGCASLTPTQISGIHVYSKLLEENADYPAAIIREFILIKYDVDQLNSGTVSPGVANEKLWASYNGKRDALEKSSKTDLCLRILKEYASALDRLSSKKLYEDIARPSEKFGGNLDRLITELDSVSSLRLPVGIGNLFSKEIMLIGRIGMRKKQIEALKQGLREGDTLVSVITQNLAEELDTLVLRQWLPSLKQDLKIKQEDLLKNLNPKGDYTVYFATQFNTEVAALIQRIDNLEQMTGKAVSSIGRIRAAHRQLLQKVGKRQDLKELLTETSNLAAATKELFEAYRTMASGLQGRR